MHFRNARKKQSEFKFSFGNLTLLHTKTNKYLGLLLDQHLSFNDSIRTLADSGSRALGSVISKLKSLKDVRYKTYLTLYNTQILPILNYCSSVWAHKKANECDVVQNKAIRYFMGVHCFTPVAAINGDMGWLPCKYRRYLCMFRLWNKLIKMEPNRLPKLVFFWDLNSSKPSWSKTVKEACDILNIQNHYQQLHVINIKDVKVKLYQRAEKEWKEEVEQKPKLRLYKTFKCNFKPESYLQNNIPRYKRSLLAQFRMGVLPLRIETGRFHLTKDPVTKLYRKLNIEERTCLICNSNAIEDEVHFLCNCIAFSEPREVLYNNVKSEIQYFDNLDDVEKLAVIVSHFEKSLICYLHSSWNIRQNVINK